MAEKTLQHTIGLILSNVTNDFSGYLMELMEDQFTAHGYKLIVTITNHRIDSEREMLTMFGQLTDGILIISDAASYDELADSIPDIPVIFLNRKPEGCPHTCILENNYPAVYQAVLSAASSNDRIGLVCSDSGFSTTKEIVDAYRAAMESTPIGFHEEWVYYAEHMHANPEIIVEELAELGCNTIFAGTQTLTRKFWDHLLVYNHNAESPIGLIGFANKDSHKQSNLSFDAITQPLQELADLSVQQMLYLIDNPQTPAREYLLKGTLRKHSLGALNLDNN